MHTRFFPLSDKAEVIERKTKIMQEFGVYDETMLVQDFMYLSDKVSAIRETKKKCIENNQIYIGG